MLFLSISCYAGQPVAEPSTQKKFPATVTVPFNNKEYTLEVTGLAVRKKFVFNVYGMAHYMHDAPRGSLKEVIRVILSDNTPKQITMDFTRNVGAGKIQSAFKEGFRKNASKSELLSLTLLIDQFCGYFEKEVKENEQFILRWLPGGKIITIVQGKEKPAITNTSFARALWSIWFGNDSIVKRDTLVEILTN
jgi:hypothetical protein